MNMVSFDRLSAATPEDARLLMEEHMCDRQQLASQIITQLRALDCGSPPTQVTILQHSLQTATLAYKAGANEEMVCVALVHDIGDKLAPDTHGEVAAAIMKPYVSAENHWLLVHHPIFQGYHFLHQLGQDRYARDEFMDHPAYAATCRFCDELDQRAFDPTLDALPLEAFEPMLGRLFANGPRF